MGRGTRACAAAACAAAALTACGTDAPDGATVLDWYVVPGRIDTAALADTCVAAAGGAYDVELHELPVDIDQRHTDLVRRLSAANGSVDVISLDTQLVAEMARADFLAPLSPGQQAVWGAGVAPGAREASTYDGELAAAPWWFDPQLLWFRGVAAERAGLDPDAPIRWADLIAGASRLGTTIQIDDVDGSATAEWFAALVASAGGPVVDDTGDLQLGTPAVSTADALIEAYREAGNPGPRVDAVDQFGSAEGGFLLAPSSALATAPLQVIAPQVGFTGYPVVNLASASPGAGSSLAVSRDSGAKAEAADLISCLTDLEQQRSLVVSTGHGAARLAVYDDEDLVAESPTAEVVGELLRDARPVPAVPTWTEVRRQIDDLVGGRP